jgi:hypothetical protein
MFHFRGKHQAQAIADCRGTASPQQLVVFQAAAFVHSFSAILRLVNR